MVASGDWLPSLGDKKNIPGCPAGQPPFGDLNLCENSLLIICLSLFDFWCCIEVYKAKWLNSECLNPSVKSKHQSFNGSV